MYAESLLAAHIKRGLGWYGSRIFSHQIISRGHDYSISTSWVVSIVVVQEIPDLLAGVRFLDGLLSASVPELAAGDGFRIRWSNPMWVRIPPFALPGT